MSIKNHITPWLTSLITHPSLLNFRRFIFHLKNRWRKNPEKAVFYFRIDDPHCWLMAQLLPEFERKYNIKVQPRVVHYLPKEMYPEPGMFAQWAIHDAKLCAQLHGLHFTENPVLATQKEAFGIARILLAQENEPGFFSIAQTICRHFWDADLDAIYSLGTHLDIASTREAELVFRQRQKNFIKQGHYLTSTLHYGGEWYWGPDRIDHLAERLSKQQGRPFDTHLLQWRKFRHHPPVSSIRKMPLEFFFSFRSPYSYIALERVIRLARFYKLKLVIRPVLPMVMRGMSVPRAKRMYILMDAKREAQRADVPFGKICDPVGKGVENCMAIWPYAEQHNKLETFVTTAAKLIWSKGVDASSYTGLRTIVQQTGLDWSSIQNTIHSDEWAQNWQQRADENRADMMSFGIWGVPAFRFDGEIFWGQDRITALEEKIIETMQEK